MSTLAVWCIAGAAWLALALLAWALCRASADDDRDLE